MSNTKKIRVRVAASPAQGFRRAGRLWPHEPTDAEVTSEELKQLKGEKKLVVVELPEEEEERPAPPFAGKGGK